MKYLIIVFILFSTSSCITESRVKNDSSSTLNSEAKQVNNSNSLDTLIPNENHSKIDSVIKTKSIGEFRKQTIDLDNDGDEDLIYLYQCAEVKCIDVYTNESNNFTSQISEFCYDYTLATKNNLLTIYRNHCCGESPFTSVRSYRFDKNNSSLYNNYVIYRDQLDIASSQNTINFGKFVLIEMNNYNVRYSSSLKPASDNESMFSCEDNTNIIGKLKIGSEVKVITELKKEERTWLFVEIENTNLVTDSNCASPISYDYPNQKLRAWISSRHTTTVIK